MPLMPISRHSTESWNMVGLGLALGNHSEPMQQLVWRICFGVMIAEKWQVKLVIL